MRARDFVVENSKDLDNIKWFSMDDDWTDSYPIIKHIGQAINATHWASWGTIGTPWSNEMIGGRGTYMLRGPFGHVMLDATTMLNKKKVALSQISVEKRGSGVGQKIMNAIKSYADSNGYSVEVYKVTNKDFFRKFDWLEQHGDGFEYSPGVNENFADGKVKGRSRPGRFKRAGVSCKGSVTSLRKKAKGSSGEKQKGYHWCANMKSGRKKKNK